MASYFSILLSVNHFSAFCWSTPLTLCGVDIFRGALQVTFLASSISKAVATIACKHTGHPLLTGSNSLEQYPTGFLIPAHS